MQFPMRILVTTFICIFFLVSTNADALDRRRDQYDADFGYLIAPFPVILPGVGTSFGVLAGVNNILGSQVDLNSIFITGDVSGRGLILTDINIIPKNLLFDLVYFNISKGQQKRYLERGMDSDPEEFNTIDLVDTQMNGARLTLTFWERMFELYAFGFRGEVKMSAIRDNQDEIITKFDEPQGSTFSSVNGGILIDYTDDRQDPRKGLAINFSRSDSPSSSESNLDYYTLDQSYTLYIPILSYSTLVFHYFKSDAHVNSQGETDPEVLKLNYDCFESDITLCESSVQEIVADDIAQNTYGSSSGLGGQSRLRSFDQGRFSSAHTIFYGIEFRWNLTDERTPYDLFFMSDIRTGLQLAAFFETGSVADRPEDLWEVSRSSTGVGARLITGSGFLYRFDVATGEEGPSVIAFFGYPWGSF